jgi:hypothetical protein
MYEQLDTREILRTAEKLERRVSERFPTASLSKLATRLTELTRDSITEVARLQRPYVLLRVGVGALLAAGLAVLALGAARLHVSYRVDGITELMQGIEATLGILFFLATGVFFFVKLEDRLKRARTLRVVQKLRTIAHVVDMHQLAKAPESVLVGLQPPSSSERTLSGFELHCYFDYSCELLALVGKVAALYAEGLADPVILDAVDDVEDLTAGMIGKIWQRLLIIDRWQAPDGGGPSALARAPAP